MRYNKDAEWYPGYEAELLRFTDGGQALADDQVDGTAWLSTGFDSLNEVEVDDFVEEEEWEMIRESNYLRGSENSGGRSVSTGY